MGAKWRIGTLCAISNDTLRTPFVKVSTVRGPGCSMLSRQRPELFVLIRNFQPTCWFLLTFYGFSSVFFYCLAWFQSKLMPLHCYKVVFRLSLTEICYFMYYIFKENLVTFTLLNDVDNQLRPSCLRMFVFPKCNATWCLWIHTDLRRFLACRWIISPIFYSLAIKVVTRFFVTF